MTLFDLRPLSATVTLLLLLMGLRFSAAPILFVSSGHDNTTLSGKLFADSVDLVGSKRDLPTVHADGLTQNFDFLDPSQEPTFPTASRPITSGTSVLNYSHTRSPPFSALG